MKNKVLVIGFGKIGQIKAKKWKELNFKVYIYDNNIKTLILAKKYGYKVIERLDVEVDYIDICVPTAHHMDYILSENLEASKKIIVEKPIVSEIYDLNQLVDLKVRYPEKAKKIILSEQYYYSKVLEAIKQNLKGEKIKSLKVKMNKNRSEDNRTGRFIDINLRAYGIELPHIFAIADYLGIDICNSNFDRSNIIYINRSATTTGCLLSGDWQGIEIVFQSFLGNRKYDIRGRSKENNLIERELSIETNNNTYKVCFDPVYGIKRYTSLLMIDKQKRIIRDDMIKSMLLGIINEEKIDTNNIEKAIKFSKKLIELRQCAKIEYI